MKVTGYGVTEQQYVNFIALFFGFFCVQLMIDANYFFGPNAAMSYFNGYPFDERTQMFARWAGVTGLGISSMPHVFDINTQKYAQLSLVLKSALIPLFVFAILKIKDATLWWVFQIIVSLVISYVNFGVFDTNNFMEKTKNISFFDFKDGYFTPKNYFNFMFFYKAFFMIGMICGADYVVGPHSIGIVFFTSLSDERGLFFCRMCGIFGLCYGSANWLFGMDATKMAKLDLVMNIVFLAVLHDIVFNGLPGATSEWDNQFCVQAVVASVNAAVLVYNTGNNKMKAKSS